MLLFKFINFRRVHKVDGLQGKLPGESDTVLPKEEYIYKLNIPALRFAVQDKFYRCFGTDTCVGVAEPLHVRGTVCSQGCVVCGVGTRWLGLHKTVHLTLSHVTTRFYHFLPLLHPVLLFFISSFCHLLLRVKLEIFHEGIKIFVLAHFLCVLKKNKFSALELSENIFPFPHRLFAYEPSLPL